MMTQNTERGSGRSTRQIAAAPHEAIYVCPTHASIFYHRSLAESLGRADLRFVGLSWIQAEAFRGNRRAVVLDHEAHARLSPQQLALLVVHQSHGEVRRS